MEADTVTLIIVNWNGIKFLPECIESLARQSWQHFETIVVDNGSIDESVAFVTSRFPEVKTIQFSTNKGFAAANNAVLNGLGSKYAALLNNDAVPHHRWLEHLVNALELHPEAGFATSKMLFYDNPDRIDRAGDAYTTAGAGSLRGRFASSSQFDKREWIFGACAGAALYRTEMLRDIGLFDEDFFLLYEDVDLSFRAQLKGYKCLYVPEAIVYHKASSSVGYDSPNSVYYGHRNLEWTFVKNMPSALLLKTIGPHIIYDFAALLYFISVGLVREFLAAKWHALRGMKKALKKRKTVQRTKRVDDSYIWSLFEKELIVPRLFKRLRKPGL